MRRVVYSAEVCGIVRSNQEEFSDVILLEDIESIVVIDSVPRSWGANVFPELSKQNNENARNSLHHRPVGACNSWVLLEYTFTS